MGNTSVTFDSFGNLFVTYLSTGTSSYTDFALSTDGGATFSHQLALANLTDQPVVAAGHNSVWVTYNRGGVNTVVGASDTGLGVIGPFGPAEPVPGANASSFGDISVGPQGQVMVAFGPNGSTGGVVVATDPDGLGPLGFTTAVQVAPTNVPGFDHIPAAPNWGIDSEAHLAWDRSGGAHSGRVYLSYLDAPAADLANTLLYVMHSDDGGATWSAPVLVNDDGTSASHFMPGFAVDQTTGVVGATWYDTRGDPTRVNARYFGSVSMDGGDTWSANFPIATGTSNATLAAPPAPIRNTDFGDYTGLAFHGGVLVPVWADNSNSTGDNPAGADSSFDLYTALVQVTTAQVAPAVTTQPAPVTVAAGSPFSFVVAASGLPIPTVQWQRSNDGGTTFVDIAGATSTTYGASAAPGDDGTRFRAVFTNGSGTATTAAATLSVTFPPLVTTQPTPVTAAAGATYSFTAAASGNPVPTVQWQRSNDAGLTWAPIGGATSTTYTATAGSGDNGAQFDAVFANGQGTATTAPATLSVSIAPYIVSSPVSQTIDVGTPYTFMAVAYGVPAPTARVAALERQRAHVVRHSRRHFLLLPDHCRTGRQRRPVPGGVHQLGRHGHHGSRLAGGDHHDVAVVQGGPPDPEGRQEGRVDRDGDLAGHRQGQDHRWDGGLLRWLDGGRHGPGGEGQGEGSRDAGHGHPLPACRLQRVRVGASRPEPGGDRDGHLAATPTAEVAPAGAARIREPLMGELEITQHGHLLPSTSDSPVPLPDGTRRHAVTPGAAPHRTGPVGGRDQERDSPPSGLPHLPCPTGMRSLPRSGDSTARAGSRRRDSS